MAQLVKCPTLVFGSGLDLRVLSSGPTLGSMLGVEPTLKKKKKNYCPVVPTEGNFNKISRCSNVNEF